MKRIAVIVLSFITLCLAGACQKSEVVSDSGRLTVLRATLPDGSSRVALSNKQLVWSEEDKIHVTFTDETYAEFTLTDGAGTASGTFSGTVPAGKTVSGATAKSSELFSDGKQLYSATAFPYSLVYTGSDLDAIEFSFDNSSYIALTLKGASSVKVASVAVNAGSDYTLDCGEGVALSETGVPFYVMLTNETADRTLKGIVVTTAVGETMTISVDKNFSEMMADKEATATTGHVFPSTKTYKKDLFSGGAGTAAYPFKLANAGDIKNFIAYSNATGIPEDWSSFDFTSASYNVTNDITMGDEDVIAPAFKAKPFTGTFDGGKKTITNLVIDNKSNIPCGLFSSAGNGSTIKNLKLMNVKVASTYVETAAFVGHAEGATLTALNIDGNDKSTITSTASITPSPTAKYGTWGQAYMTVVGGVVGYAYDTNISDCTVAGRPSTKHRLVGGIAAYAGGNTNISNCTIGKYSWVKAGDTLCGGIVGASESTGTIKDCKVYGTIESVKQYCGGIVGATNYGSIKNCTVGTAGAQKASIKGNGYNYIGGICGSITGTVAVEGCKVMNTDIISAAGAYMGFVVGQIDGVVKVNISNCVVGSKCMMSAKTWAGGILGAAANGSNSSIVINQCSSYGSITTAANANGVGGIAGALSGVANVQNAYVLVSNCLYEKGTLTATSTSPNLGGIVGQCGHTTLTSCPQEYIVNCYTKGATLSDNNATTHIAGIAGRTDGHNHIFGCYTDVVAGTTLVQNLGNNARPIFYWMPAYAANDNSVQHVYYDKSFASPGRGGTGVESIAPAEGIDDFTDGYFLDKMNAAASAYNAAPLVDGTSAVSWVPATGGPTLETAIADPDK